MDLPRAPHEALGGLDAEELRKGVAYAEVDGRGMIYLVTPAFFLHAIDPATGRPVPSFGQGGTVDFLDDLGPWEHDRDAGLPPEIGYITKMTGEELGAIDLPRSTITASMTYMHDGAQYVVMAVKGRGLPGSLVALRLPEETLSPPPES